MSSATLSRTITGASYRLLLPRSTPFFGICLSLILGVSLDRCIGISPFVSIALTVVALVLWWGLSCRDWSRREAPMQTRGPASSSVGCARVGTALLCISASTLGAAWHHLHWHWVAGDGVYALLSEHESIKVDVRGVMFSEPVEHRERMAGRVGPRVRFQLRLRAVRVGMQQWAPASGETWVYVDGRPATLRIGDHVRAVGTLCRYGEPLNPAERDRAREQRVLGRHGFLRLPHASCIRLEGIGEGGGWAARLRTHWLAVLGFYLPSDKIATVAALLLGRRDLLDAEQRERYLRTGTAHLLAISGLHVGILASGFVWCVRGGLVPFRVSVTLLILLLAGYCRLTDAGPPVIRATLLVQAFCLAWVLRRRLPAVNLLALAGCWLVVRSPLSVFQVGTQLSFLAVVTLGRIVPTGPRDEEPLQRLIRRSRSLPRRALESIGQVVWRLFVACLIVWCVTLPLSLEAFHLVPLAAVPSNLLIWLPLVLTLVAGFSLLTFDFICPVACPLVARLCAAGVSGMDAVLTWADEGPLRPLWLGPLGTPYVVAIYCLVFSAWLLPSRFARWRWTQYLVAASLFLVAVNHPVQRQSDECHVTFLSLGHGTCVVLEFPCGRTWVYDAGRMGEQRTGVDCVSRFLWSRRIRRIDRLIVSHADSDHFNLVPGLLERFEVRRLCCAFDPRRADLDLAIRRALDQRSLRAEQVEAGTIWYLPRGSRIEVLHPDRSKQYRSDNEQSIVLRLEFAGRKLLLPGDVEGSGLSELLSQSREQVDVAMAPHHGSLSSAPAAFVDWCRPRDLIISGASIDQVDLMRRELGDRPVRVWHTRRDGAVRCQLSEQGCSIVPYRDRGAGARFP